MNRADVEAFLRAHQPFLASERVPPEVIAQFDEVRQYLLSNPEVPLVELLLGVFGPGDLFGRYQLLEDIVRVTEGDLVPRVKELLASGSAPVQYWNAQLAGVIGDPRLTPALGALLQNSDFDTRYAAISSLETIGGPTATQYLHEALNSEQEPELVALLTEALR